jgi:hypothetical protein
MATAGATNPGCRLASAGELRFGGKLSSGTPRIPIRIGHPAASGTRGFQASFDLRVPSMVIPASVARSLDLAVVLDGAGVPRTQVSFILSQGDARLIGDGSAMIVSDSDAGVPEITLGTEILHHGVLAIDGPADEWSWTVPG